MNVQEILHTLGTSRRRATYSAVAEYLGVHRRSVAKLLGSRRPEASWIVSARTGLPSGYLQTEMHPNLKDDPRIIRTGRELSNLVSPAMLNETSPGMVTNTTRLAGVDLAWNCAKNCSGLAIGELRGRVLFVESATAEVLSTSRIAGLIAEVHSIRGVAIDAPLIVKNRQGSRPCEAELSAYYRKYWAGAYPTNLQNPWKSGIKLSAALEHRAFEHLGRDSTKWQIECYPHPAIVEIFGLAKRLKYKNKKGMSTEDVRQGQINLATLLVSLSESSMLSLRFAESVLTTLQPAYITTLTGTPLKQSEDSLDAVLCLYIAGLYELNADARVFGDTDSGYIYVPTSRS